MKIKFWLIYFGVLLALIPILISIDLLLLAKSTGILLVVSFFLVFRSFLGKGNASNSKKNRVALTINDKFWLEKHITFYKKLNSGDRIIFENRIGLFINDVIITEVDREIPEKATCLYVASSATIAYWGLPYWNFGELSEVLVYPVNFNLDNSLNTNGRIEGKVHHGGLMDSTMILSKTALIEDFNLSEGQNVGVHEFSHLIDKEDGNIDGVPCVLDKTERQIWASLVAKELRSKPQHFKMNPYGYTNEEEFFAVLMEMYREKESEVEKRFPELYLMLKENLPNPD